MGNVSPRLRRLFRLSIKSSSMLARDPKGLVSYAENLGVATQAYSPLGDGSSELITGSLVTNIGKAHGMSGAQVSMNWLIQHDVAVTTKTTKLSHMQDDLGIFGFSPKQEELQSLDTATSPSGKPSWACRSESEI